MFYTYVLKSTKDSKRYIGYTSNLKKRLQDHNNGKVAATRDRRPMILIYYEACHDKVKARLREKYFKTGYGREFLDKRL